MDHHTPTFVLIPIVIGEAKKPRMLGTYAHLRCEDRRCEAGQENDLIARLQTLFSKARGVVADLIRNA
jgi:hypothetical protein